MTHSPHKPYSLESLVPPLDLCRKIPKGDFEYSALTWNEGYVKGNFVIEQRGLGRYYICPAPTLQEILNTLSEIGEPVTLTQWKTGQIAVSCQIGDDSFEEVSQNGASAALKLYLKLNSPSIPSIPTPEVLP